MLHDEHHVSHYSPCRYIREAAQIKNVVQADIESLEARRDRALMQENESLKAMNAALAEEVSALRAAGTSSTEPRSSPEVVILSTEEHEALLREAQQWKDRATALEVVLKDADGRYRQVQEELKAAVQRADSAEAAAAAVQPAALTPTAALPDRSAVTDASATAGTPAAAVGGGAGISPGLAALAISPILSAAHSHSMELKSARGQRPEAVTEALLAQEPLTVGDICLDQDESNMAPDQVKVLQELVGRRLAELEHAAPGPAAGEDTAARTLAALKLRSAEVDLLRLAVRSYNECLGSVVSELELSQAREAETLAQFQRAAREKVEYVQMVAQYGAALDRSEANVLQLNYQVEEARRQSMPGVSPSTGLLGRVMGARGTPAHSPPVSPAKPARPQSEDPQRSQSPPQQRPQQRRTEGHQQQQEAESSSGPRRWTSALGGLFKGSPAATQGTQTPAMSPPSSSPPRSPGPSPGPSPRQALDDHHAGQGVRGAPETGREPSHGGALEPFPLDLADLSDGAGSEKAASVIEILSDDGDEGGGSGIIEAYMEDDLQQAPSRRQLLPNGVVPTTRQERQLQLQMQGGVDVGAISARRGQQISEQFKQQNTHWRAPGDEKKKEGASRKR